MTLILSSIVVIVLGGIAALAMCRRPRVSSAVAASAAVLGAGIGLVPAIRALLGAPEDSLRAAWSVPVGSLHLALDPLSALFVVPILVITAAAAVYGVGYLREEQGPRAGVSWFFFSLLTASMLLVTLARDAVLFLVAWEGMSLASFFLVAYDDRKESVRRAAWVYLVAMHIGAVVLIALFILLGRQAGALDFDALGAAAGMPTALVALCFVLAVVGFGMKAGFLPLHVWLPEAHPSAPSHVSAVMSGVMIKTGIYGLMRALTFFGTPPAWWGWVLLGIGLTSGILGVLYALAQHDLKRLLAYHSVENIGIIALGLGLGVLGTAYGMPAVRVLGFGGAALHVINHALFKGLLFLGAGSVIHATHEAEIDRLGGLLKRMPRTGTAFLVGSMAISGVPPFNGFISELMIFLAALAAIGSDGLVGGLAGALALAGLALIGGLAVACFTKAFGVIFLGEPRTDEAAHAHESSPTMTAPMLALAAACLLVGLTAPWFLPATLPSVLSVCAPGAAGEGGAVVAASLKPLTGAVVGAAVLAGLVLALAALRRMLLRKRTVTQSGTWDCGYARPTARMQYTASSFAQPLMAVFRGVVRTLKSGAQVVGLFPRGASRETHTPDFFTEGFLAPLFRGGRSLLSHARRIQQGQVQVYVLYIVVTLIVLMIWKLG